MKINLNEDTRQQLLYKSKSSVKGNQRFKRRLKSRIANSVKEFNSIDMNQLFKEGILTVNIKINGETNNYIVKIKFGGFLDLLHEELAINNYVLNSKVITRTLIKGFNREDTYIFCNCPDFFYRFGYWTTRTDINSGEPQNIPSNITNPNNTLGSACKHVLLVLNNNTWILKVAAVIYNYINYMKIHYKKLYADVIYPAIYEQEYNEDDIQLTLFDNDVKIATDKDKDEIDKANAEAKNKSLFKKGNTQGIRFASNKKDDVDQLKLNI